MAYFCLFFVSKVNLCEEKIRKKERKGKEKERKKKRNKTEIIIIKDREDSCVFFGGRFFICVDGE